MSASVGAGERACYWWEAAPLSDLPTETVAPTADVVIVGAGYTGLSAALTLARSGRSVQIFDSRRPGAGASTRNGGITSGNLRPGFAELTNRFGEARATAMLRESKAAREDLYRFIAEEKIECDFSLVGRFTGATAPSDYDRLAREAEALRKVGIEAEPVPRGYVHRFLGTDFYHGGSVRMDIGGLHPAKLHAGMLRLVRQAGAKVHGETAVISVAHDKSGCTVKTDRGKVRAPEVIICTNGYADGLDPWLRRRIVPVRSRITATSELPDVLMARLMPRRMMCIDTRKLSYYYRPSPGGRRILFGGRDGTVAGDPDWPTEHLRGRLVEIFPELEGVAITHSWFGYVGMNRDLVPRIFDRNGPRHYATGFCGSGVVWARWAGQKAARQLIGGEEQSAFHFRPPPAVPLFRGDPWFMPTVFAWLSLRDRLRTWPARPRGR